MTEHLIFEIEIPDPTDLGPIWDELREIFPANLQEQSGRVNVWLYAKEYLASKFSPEDVRFMAEALDGYFSEYGTPDELEASRRILTLLGINIQDLMYIKEEQ